MTDKLNLPFFMKVAQLLLGIFLGFYILFLGQHILLPLAFALIFAILLNPAVNFLTKHGFGHVLAIFTALVLAILVVGGLLYFLISQATMFSDTFPQLRQKFDVFINDGIEWASRTFHTPQPKIKTWLNKTTGEGLNNSTSFISSTLYSITNAMIVLLLIPVYIFFILFYKTHLLEFLRQLFDESRHKMVVEILRETNSLIQKYLTGLMFEAAIVATLNSIGLLIIGVDYAILLGVIGALLNIIPYIGGIIAILLPLIIAIATKSGSAALLVLLSYGIVQFIDNHVIVPKIVASRVQLNALVSILVVLIGGALFGVAGMFLSIPVTAIVKVIFDRIEQLKPWGYLLGDTMPGGNIFRWNLRGTRKKRSQDAG